MVTSPWPRRPGQGPPQPHSPDGDHRGQLPPIRCQPLPVLPRGARRTAWLDWAAASPQAGTPNQSSCRRGGAHAPRT